MNTWILLANAHRARCFARRGANGDLMELENFVYPQTRLTQPPQAANLTADAGKGHGNTGHSGTQFEPHTSVQRKERDAFAHTLAEYINKASTAHNFDKLVLAASAPMLGAIRPLLAPQAKQLLVRALSSDITHYQGPELLQHINHILALPD